MTFSTPTLDREHAEVPRLVDDAWSGAAIRHEGAVSIHQLDPLTDPRWPEFLARHPAASIFHSPGWLRSLAEMYRYEPVVWTTTPPGRELSDGVVLCRVRSLLTGRRLVSLPFSDHCEPLAEGPQGHEILFSALRREVQRGGWKYVEIRPLSESVVLSADEEDRWGRHEAWHHVLRLHDAPEELLKSFHNTAIRQTIRRAEREGLEYVEGCDESLLRQFYLLLLQTRRKHKLPPAPARWFRTLARNLGSDMQVRVARKDGQPVAAIATLTYKRICYYKYSCLDARYGNLGGTPMLLWRTIQRACEGGYTALDMGRSDHDNEGLLTFKDRWNAERSVLRYYCYPSCGDERPEHGRIRKAAEEIFSRLPDRMLVLAGDLLYRHMG